jgi:hypothetical protein
MSSPLVHELNSKLSSRRPRVPYHALQAMRPGRLEALNMLPGRWRELGEQFLGALVVF